MTLTVPIACDVLYSGIDDSWKSSALPRAKQDVEEDCPKLKESLRIARRDLENYKKLLEEHGVDLPRDDSPSTESSSR